MWRHQLIQCLAWQKQNNNFIHSPFDKSITPLICFPCLSQNIFLKISKFNFHYIRRLPRAYFYRLFLHQVEINRCCCSPERCISHCRVFWLEHPEEMWIRNVIWIKWYFNTFQELRKLTKRIFKWMSKKIWLEFQNKIRVSICLKYSNTSSFFTSIYMYSKETCTMHMHK